MSTQTLIVGGGLGGTMLANQLASTLFDEVVRNDVRITLLSDSPDHDYKPALMDVTFGACVRRMISQRADARRALAAASRDRVRRRSRDAFRLRDAARAHEERQRYGYDHLAITTGCAPSPERIEGLAEAGDHLYPYEPARRLAGRIASIDRGTVFVSVTSPKTHNVPHQCGIAPIDANARRRPAPPRRARQDRDRLHVPDRVAVAAQLPVPAKAGLRRAARVLRAARLHARARRSGAQDRVFGGKARNSRSTSRWRRRPSARPKRCARSAAQSPERRASRAVHGGARLAAPIRQWLSRDAAAQSAGRSETPRTAHRHSPLDVQPSAHRRQSKRENENAPCLPDTERFHPAVAAVPPGDGAAHASAPRRNRNVTQPRSHRAARPSSP